MTPTPTPTHCPTCHEPLQVVTDGEVSRLWFTAATSRVDYRLEAGAFAACPTCEFCIVIEHGGRR